jgi:hypothetical protein
MHPNGQLPAYEFAFRRESPRPRLGRWRVYKMTAPRGQRDTRVPRKRLQKLLMNFTWWVNRKDPRGKNIFAGGFLGLDNIGVFDRSKPLPGGGHLEQADGTAWMAFYCLDDARWRSNWRTRTPRYEDIASQVLRALRRIADAMNTSRGSGLWDEEDGFYYDKLLPADRKLGALPPLLRRQLARRMPDGLRHHDESARSGARIGLAAGEALPARRGRTSPMPWRRRTLRQRCRLARSAALLRALPRRRRPRARRQPPDGLDGAGRDAAERPRRGSATTRLATRLTGGNASGGGRPPLFLVAGATRGFERNALRPGAGDRRRRTLLILREK